MASKKVKGYKMGLGDFAMASASDPMANLPSAPDPNREYDFII